MGRLVLVVGPSGAGKDTLLAKAREALAKDPRFAFVRRVVTRPSDAGFEDHDTMSPEAFAQANAAGAFALTWEAHGLSYGLPATIDHEIRQGRICIANGSRRMLAEALARYPDLKVILIDAPVDVRARRLAARGRESLAEVSGRLAREAPVPADIPVIRIDNSGAIEPATSALLNLLRGMG
jgi:phosphonate metabolism protein PhnN/1,5-bisphosphokinase (PRPP-forming)